MKVAIIPNKNEEGFVIVFVLMILVIVTIIGISSSRTSLTEQKIARNEMLYKETFYNSDSGPYTLAKLISKTINEKNEQTAGTGNDFVDFSFITSQADIFGQIMGFDDYDGGAKDVSFGNGNTQVDIRRDRTTHAAGGSTEFASGSEGVGTGSKGGIHIYYSLDSDGRSIQNQTHPTNIAGIYRKVPDITGGL